MELENLRRDLLTIINHYGKTIPIGPLFYVVKDVTREVADAYNQWIDKQQQENMAAPAEATPQPVEEGPGVVDAEAEPAVTD